MTSYEISHYESACAAIRKVCDLTPHVGLILGTGLGPLAGEIEDSVVIPYADIPNFPVSSAPGHTGQMVIGKLCGKFVMAMQGRVHMYEGYSPAQVTFPVRVMKLMGVEKLVITNAAGGINEGFKAGDLMLIEDHINFPGATGSDPLRGINIEVFGPGFTSMTQAYDLDLMKLAKRVAHRLDIPIRTGVYAYWAGPTFETPAEIRMFRSLGADAVSMSTVPEVVVANHCGMKVLGISTITNIAVSVLGSGRKTTEEEVMATAALALPKFVELVKNILSEM